MSRKAIAGAALKARLARRKYGDIIADADAHPITEATTLVDMPMVSAHATIEGVNFGAWTAVFHGPFLSRKAQGSRSLQ